jgi:hypothetical protein
MLLGGVIGVLATLLTVLLELRCLEDTQDLHSIGNAPRLLFDYSGMNIAQLELRQVHMSHKDYTCNLLVGLGEAVYQEQRNQLFLDFYTGVVDLIGHFDHSVNLGSKSRAIG